MSEEEKLKIYLNLSKEEYEEIKKTYQGFNFDSWIKKTTESFNKHPFKSRERIKYCDEIKRSFTFVNEDYKEEQEETPIKKDIVLSQEENEMIETLYPYFKKEVCNYSDELCGQLDTLPEKLNCEDLI